MSLDSTEWIIGQACLCGDKDCCNLKGLKMGISHSESDVSDHSFVVNSDCVAPYFGQHFNNDEAAYQYYVNFAKKNGFSVRKNRVLRNEEHSLGVYMRDYVCHRAGAPRSQKVPEIEKRRNRKSSRCNCSSKMSITKIMGEGITKWKVKYFSNSHNHELLEDNEVKYLPAYRNIDDVDKKQIMLLAKAGCQINLIKRVLELEKGIEPGQLQFTEKDIRNFLQNETQHDRENDALGLVKLCKVLKDQDPDFKYEYTTDESNRLQHVIWAFGDSIRAYEIFGDVVVFDTTYRLNRYDMPPWRMGWC